MQPRPMGAVNWLGLYTLTAKEISRFMKVHAQTISAPVVTALLYYLVFYVAMGGSTRVLAGVGYMQFLAPGLIMMMIIQNAFANTSSSLIIAKVQGNIVDVLMPPLSPGELMAGYAIGGVVRGLVVGIASGLTMALLVPMPLSHPWAIVFYGIMGSLMLSVLGIIGGIWADKFDHMAAIQNFIVLPATFLSGTFYMATQLPENWQFVLHLNPVFYMIDGFRYGFIGISDGTLGIGAIVLIVMNLALLGLTYAMFKTGYKLKS